VSATLYYLDDFTDEVMPCKPTLKAWAAWLSEPDPDWPHEIPTDGKVFKASTLQVLGDVRADHDGERWVFTPEIPAGADSFYLRHYEGSEGWDAECSGADPQTVLEECAKDESAFLACCRSGPRVIAIYQAGPPPALLLDVVQ
jgi:hypothetical protein